MSGHQKAFGASISEFAIVDAGRPNTQLVARLSGGTHWTHGYKPGGVRQSGFGPVLASAIPSAFFVQALIIITIESPGKFEGVALPCISLADIQESKAVPKQCQ